MLRPIAERRVEALCPSCESRNSMPLISVTASAGREWSSGTSDAPKRDTQVPKIISAKPPIGAQDVSPDL